MTSPPSPGAPWTLQFHESEVRAVAASGSRLTVHLAAARLAPRGRVLGQGSEDVYLRHVDLILDGAQWSGQPSACLGRLSEGHWSDGTEWRARFVAPEAIEGAIRLALSFTQGERLDVHATSWQVRLHPDSHLLAAYAC